MTEEEAEDGIVPEVMPEHQMALLVRESELEPSVADFLMEKYKDHFKLAAEWAKKAKNIIVTDESQTVNMQMAKTGRLFLRKQRLEIENTRKMLKAGALKECQCIDRLSNFLKDVIIPTEEHLDRQEHFIEYREKAKQDAIKAEIEKRMEEERIAKEKADAEALKIAQAENERLRKEQAERDKVEAERRRILQEKIDKERAAERAEAAKIFEENNRKLAQERAEREKIEAELRAKRQAEQKAEADRIRAEEKLKSAGDVEKLVKFRSELKIFISQFPEIKDKSLIRIAEDAKSHLWLAHSELNQITQEEE